MSYLFALLLLLVLLACWAVTLVGAPGNWLMVAFAAVYAWLMPGGASTAIGWKTIAAVAVLAALGELVELLAGAAETARAGGTRRGAMLALLGALGGGVVGLLVGIPVPLIGSAIAALLFAALGAMTGAILGEVWAGRKLGASWHVGRAAFRGRLVGTLGKMILGAAIFAVVVIAMIVR